ncbi:MAG TPA: cytochrome c biogenesis protein CcsA [Candidatus Latescibacteria bacterium]|nr:hypothetical protein [Gemmatimonadaceae bacterium]MDP6015282.1 cytochrome c biogenesis protein CcsA [Candidatus Latescibacterota bacterium]HJP31676.1 cytochrome c biogenesis protein CcsA [Candidatus Latescibacterota bacterium]
MTDLTTSCLVFLGVSLGMYATASLLFQGHLWWGHASWERWGRSTLIAGIVINALGIMLHVLFSGQYPLGNMVSVISLVVITFLVAGLLLERFTSVRHFNLFVAPVAFLGLLYPLLMPVRFVDSGSMLVKYPWLGVHVFITLLGHVGFALAFCGAGAFLLQSRALKRGRLNRFLPALDTSAASTFYAAAGGFFFFSLGLGMGVIWLFGAPGEYLGRGDPKIVLALPTWCGFAWYLYLRGVQRRHGSQLKWLVIIAFVIAVINYIAVPHQFGDDPTAPASAVELVPAEGLPV